MLPFLFLLHHYYIIITSFFMLFYVFRAFECVFKNTKSRKKKSVNDHAFVKHKCARRASRLTRASKLNEKGGMTACMTIFPKKEKSEWSKVHSDVVQVVGIEPTRYHYHRILSPARLPVPPHLHVERKNYDTIKFLRCQGVFANFYSFFHKSAMRFCVR